MVEPSAVAAGFKVSAARLASVQREVRFAVTELPELYMLTRGMADELEAMEVRLRELSDWLAGRPVQVRPAPRPTAAPARVRRL